MDIIEVALSDLKPYENNPRKNDDAVDAVKASIKEFGFKVPIVIDKNNVIAAGHTRYKAAKKLGLKSVPCIIADDLNDEQIKAFRLADNKVGELAAWDIELLFNELETITLDMFDFGFENIDDELEKQKQEFKERMRSGELSEDSEEYQEFLQKFEAKKTTDDCYTPEPIYEVVANYVSEHYKVKRTSFVRPFVPGGDYENYKYPKNCIVVDNPPFSIMSEILTFYNEHKIKYFLFAPSLTCFTSKRKACAIVLDVTITYENGAKVNTSFLTNMETDVARTDPELYQKLVEEDKLNNSNPMPNYDYPNEVITAAMMSYLSKYGQKFVLKDKDCSDKISYLESQKEKGKGIFGGGYLLSEKAAAEKAAAIIWTLSEKEKDIIKSLG